MKGKLKKSIVSGFLSLMACAMTAACTLSVHASAVSLNFMRPTEELTAVIEQSASVMLENFEDPSLTYDIEDAYLVYEMQEFPLTAYQESSDFGSLITDNVKVHLPYADGDMVFDTEGNFLEMTTATEPTFYPDEVEALIAQSLDLEEISNITVTYSAGYRTMFVYIEADAEDYVVPYCSMVNLDELRPAVYTAADFMEAMNATFDESRHIAQIEETGYPLLGGGCADYLDESAKALLSLQPCTRTEMADESKASDFLGLPRLIGGCCLLAAAGVTVGILAYKKHPKV